MIHVKDDPETAEEIPAENVVTTDIDEEAQSNSLWANFCWFRCLFWEETVDQKEALSVTPKQVFSFFFTFLFLSFEDVGVALDLLRNQRNLCSLKIFLVIVQNPNYKLRSGDPCVKQPKLLKHPIILEPWLDSRFFFSSFVFVFAYSIQESKIQLQQLSCPMTGQHEKNFK